MIDILEQINNQHSYYIRGLLTYSEMLENIIRIAEDEKPRRIEYRHGNRGSWKPFNDNIYTKEEAADVLKTLEYNSLGLTFRATA